MKSPARGFVAWTLLLSGPLIWWAHFVLVYAAASLEMTLVPATGPGISSRIAIALLTLAALVACALVWTRARADTPLREGTDVRRFWANGTRLLVLVSGIAILFQALPALIVP